MSKRLILNFDQCVYQEERQCWYLLDYEKLPTINDLLSDVSEKFELKALSALYVNGIIAPKWESTKIICPDQGDTICIASCKKRTMDTVAPHTPLISSEKQKDAKVLEHDVTNTMSIFTPKPSVEKPIQVDEVISGTAEGNDNNMEVEVLEVSKPPKKSLNPYLQRHSHSSLKINNNFKRKLQNTTPIHRDRYTNRSKVYTSPLNPKRTSKISPQSNIPVAAALKAALKETVSCPLPKKPPEQKCGRGIIGASACGTIINDSINKNKIFEDRVSSIINKPATVKSDSDSTTSTSSEDDETAKQPTKIRKTDNKVSSKMASSSDSSESEPNPPKVPPNPPKPSKKVSSSDSSESEPSPQKVPPNPSKMVSSSDSSESERSSPKVPPKVPPNQLEAVCPKVLPDQPKTSKTESTSTSDSSQSGTSPTKVPPDKRKSSNKRNKKHRKRNKVQNSPAPKSGKIVNNPQPSSTESDSSNDPKGAVPDAVEKEESPKKDDINSKGNYDLLADLQGAPRVADKLAFKMLDLNQTYCPVISEYKEGVITEYDCTSQLIKVKLFPAFVDQMKSGKFEMEDDAAVQDTIELNLKQLIEPKLLPV